MGKRKKDYRMGKEKIEQNEERIWGFIFHTLGIPEKDAVIILNKLLIKINKRIKYLEKRK